MEVMAALGLMQTIFSAVKGMYNLCGQVVRFRQEAREFIEFIQSTERLLMHQNSVLHQYHEGRRALPMDVADHLRVLYRLLQESNVLFQRLTNSMNALTNAPDEMRRLMRSIQNVQITMLWIMVMERQEIQPIVNQVINVIAATAVDEFSGSLEFIVGRFGRYFCTEVFSLST
ncbi:hypothetical protein R1flu_015384 [Riccia fluitans]|uniref:Uncharacterized protein n=1 Tax=Riccia fluitans TaxID=41844 RepID=A0ABD1YJ62_9MARC